jgi:hypothetical protein
MVKEDLLESVKDLTEIIDQSGIELNSRDQIGNVIELCSMDLAIMAVILVREDLTAIEKSMMLYGSIHSPVSQNINKKMRQEA